MADHDANAVLNVNRAMSSIILHGDDVTILSNMPFGHLV